MSKQVFCDHKKVEQMWRMNFSGNIIPMTWYKTIQKKDGKPDTTAIILLSEIVYWYRPQEIRDEITGEFIGLRKKFHDDQYLQKGYQELADTFGFGYQEVQRAIKRLEDIGVICRIFKNIRTKTGVLCNALFIDLDVDRLAELTYQAPETEQTEATPSSDTDVSLSADVERDTSLDNPEDAQGRSLIAEPPTTEAGRPHKNETPSSPVSEPLKCIIRGDDTPYRKRQDVSSGKMIPPLITAEDTSYQERQGMSSGMTTPPITRDRSILSDAIGHIHRLHTESITKSSSSESTSRFREEPDVFSRKKTIPKTNEQELKISRSRMKEVVHANIQYDELLLNEDKQLTDEIVRVMVDVLCADQETIKVNGMEMPAGVVKSRLLKMTPRHVETVIENMRDVTSRIVNMPRYLLSALYNATMTPNHNDQVMINRLNHT